MVQGVGAAMLFANSTAILTDAFPAERRGMALGINQVAAIAGSFIGLIVGGLLAGRLAPGVLRVRARSACSARSGRTAACARPAPGTPARIDWWGNVAVRGRPDRLLSAITYGIQPYGGHTMGWTNPWVLAGLIGGVALLGRVRASSRRGSTSRCSTCRCSGSSAFAAGNLAGLLASVGRGGLQFMLIIWLQGIWLPLHGYSFEHPAVGRHLLLPLTVGVPRRGADVGQFSDRFGARTFATGGLLLVAVSFVGLMLLPTDFNYWAFAGLLVLNGIGSGLFSAPNTTAIMNSVPANQRGAASGMRGHLLQRRYVAVDRDLLHADDHRAGADPPPRADATASGPRSAAGRRIRHRPPAAGRQPVRRLPRLQPDRRRRWGPLPARPRTAPT